VPETYRPREARFHGPVATGGGQIKLSLISCDGVDAIPRDLIDAAIAMIGGAEAPAHEGAGFAILHRGEEANWLLLHWWIAGGIATHTLWRAEKQGPPAFHPAAPGLMACVWELAVIDFERRAWIETGMAGEPIADYVARELPAGEV